MVQMNLTVPQAPERSGPVILSAAKDLTAGRERPFAALRVTRYHCSNGQGHFIQIEPCLNKLNRPPVGADLSRPPPIYRPKEGQRYSDYFVKPHNRAPTHRTSVRSSGREAHFATNINQANVF